MKIFNKLVRDKIPEIIEAEGRKTKIRILSNEEFRKELNIKLQEEVKEYLEDNNIEELADIIEVIYGIVDSMDKNVDDLENIRKEKELKRGSFKKHFYLETSE